MFKKLVIRNFQSHAETEIELAPTVTAIVGPNNHGKSAIFRALKKVVRNDPEGTTFIRDGEAMCEIEVTTDSGVVLRRIRSDGASDANLYVVNDLPFAKFGKTGIPEEVLTVLGVSDIQRFGDLEYDLNFQDQLDPLFLVQGQGLASIRGKVLGKVTGVDQVQRAIQYGASEERRLSKDQERLEKEREGLRAQLGAYDGLGALIEAFGAFGVERLNLEAETEKVDALDALLTHISACVVAAERAAAIVNVIPPDFDACLVEIERQQQLLLLAEQALHLESEIAQAEAISNFVVPDYAEIECQQQLLALIETAVATEQEIAGLQEVAALRVPELQEIENAQVALDETTSLSLTILAVAVDKDNYVQKIEQLERDFLAKQADIRALEAELGVCPTCERPF